MNYIALLRGINIGGRQAPSAALRRIFEEAGFTSVRTVLASGNITFDAGETARAQVITAAEEALRKGLGYEVAVQVRTPAELKHIIETAPFADIEVTAATRFYISFYAGTPKGTLAVPYQSDDGGIKILRQTAGEVYGVVTLSKTTGTTDYLELLDREYGTTITTRNRNTLVKLTGN